VPADESIYFPPDRRQELAAQLFTENKVRVASCVAEETKKARSFRDPNSGDAKQKIVREITYRDWRVIGAAGEQDPVEIVVFPPPVSSSSPGGTRGDRRGAIRCSTFPQALRPPGAAPSCFSRRSPVRAKRSARVCADGGARVASAFVSTRRSRPGIGKRSSCSARAP
jgi:hypothetical protein